MHCASSFSVKKSNLSFIRYQRVKKILQVNDGDDHRIKPLSGNFQTVFFLLPVYDFFRVCLQKIEENHELALNWMFWSSVIPI